MNTVKLGDITFKIGSGATPRGGKSVYVSDGIALVRSQNVLDLAITRDGLAFIDDEAASKLAGAAVEPGDVLINITGDSTARVALWDIDLPARVNQHVAILRPDPTHLNSRWLQYWLAQPRVKSHLLVLASSGASRPALTKGMLSALKISLPTLAQQDKVASVLGSLDDKIAANQTAVNTGTELLMSLYRRVQKHSAEPFGRVCDVFGGSTPSTKVGEYWGGNINWATPTDLTALRGPWLSETERKITEAGLESMSSTLHPPGSILMTSRATIGHVAVAATPVTTNQGFIVIRASEKLTPWIFCQLQDRVREFEAWSNGATFLEISRGNFKKLPFYRAEPQDLAEFNEKAKPLLDMSKAKQAENIALAKTRDELLPLLMSGKISVREASQEAAAAGAPIPGEENEV